MGHYIMGGRGVCGWVLSAVLTPILSLGPLIHPCLLGSELGSPQSPAFNGDGRCPLGIGGLLSLHLLC